jgi:NAD(P)-dependent dehydrogenase (short-subunit alcohol dehydrogenase family)
MNEKQGINPQVDRDRERAMGEIEPRGAPAPPLHVVFGATGGIGRAVTEELVRRGR